MSAAAFTANLAAYLLQTTLLLAAGLFLPRLFGMRDPQVRLRYWHALLAFSLLLPFARLAGRAPALSSGSFTGRLAGGMEVQVHAGQAPVSPWVWVPVALAVVAAARVFWLLGGLLLLERLRRRSRALSPLPEALEEASSTLFVDADFRVSRSVSTPLTFGWLRPVVLLPEAVAGMPLEEQRCVALHELLHVRRRDWLVILFEESLRSLLWFHPALWLVLDRVALSREQAVDLEVVHITEARRTYMSTLSAMARTRFPAAAVAILPFFHRSHLLQRLALLTQEVSMSKLRLAFAAAGCATALLLCGALASRAFPLLGQDGSPAGPAPASPSSGTTQGGEAAVYSMETKGIIEPKLIKQVEFVRPASAPDRETEVIIVLSLVITDKGVPTEIRVLRSGNDALSKATIDAVSQFRWEPAKLSGKPVSVNWTFTTRWGV
jgi:beta-lactamase regulating signal transducer with metallopeptidase domain